MSVHIKLVTILGLAGCISTVGGNERALFYSAHSGMSKQSVGPGWYWHLPWNHYEKYDLRWKEHHEQIHMHTKDGLHLDIEVAVVVRPNPEEIYDLDVSVGPAFYDQVVRPALFAATRDGGGQFNHLDVATRTHEVEQSIKAAMVEHLHGHHIEVGEIAIQHFDLPPDVEAAANRTAASAQLIAAKEVERRLAEKDAEQKIALAEQQLKIEEAMRKSQREKADADAEILQVKAEAEAKVIRARADAEKERILAEATNLTPNYVRLQAVKTLADALHDAKLVVVPVGANGLPSFFSPFLNPMSGSLEAPKP